MKVGRAESLVYALRRYSPETTIEFQHFAAGHVFVEADALRQKTHQPFRFASIALNIKAFYGNVP